MRARLEIYEVPTGVVENDTATITIDFTDLHNFLALQSRIDELMESFQNVLEKAMEEEDNGN